jgi:hypothetical protein
MPVVGASEFVRSFGRFQDEAYREVVKVTSHGRVIGGYLSAPDLEHFERLKRREREVLIVGELSDDIVADIEAAEYGTGPQ